MLTDKKLKVFIPTIYPEKARVFYGMVLGFDLTSEDDFSLEFDANGTPLRVTIVPELIPHKFTILGWTVPDIHAEIESLRSKGVTFDQYDFLIHDEDGVWTSSTGAKVAWFKDPDGNILSIGEDPK